ncbi:hypothetical protein [Paraburkholderia acidisoli]|uniref:Uncharacterized protein n=1 Tax=Paraburkholderia acidisoli TaxID=2571748 RepID=A0A7Z2JFX7_9BURK|nr:hypothetical protein [Paraburkholderia acidisoli]QGZ62363.1 hypothetical protein FAZ98_11845 [Paraburkholderia acidisoli]
MHASTRTRVVSQKLQDSLEFRDRLGTRAAHVEQRPEAQRGIDTRDDEEHVRIARNRNAIAAETQDETVAARRARRVRRSENERCECSHSQTLAIHVKTFDCMADTTLARRIGNDSTR